MRFGVLASVTANFSMGKDPQKPPLQPRDFFPSLPQAPEYEQSFEEMAAIIQLAAARGRQN